MERKIDRQTGSRRSFGDFEIIEQLSGDQSLLQEDRQNQSQIDRQIGKYYFKKMERLLREEQSLLEADQLYRIDCFEKFKRLLKADEWTACRIYIALLNSLED